MGHGIGMVSQHYSIIPELSCLQNLVLGAEDSAFLNNAKLKAKAQKLAESMGYSFDWDSKAAGLSPAGAQKLEILRLLWRDARILILDEPTAMLSPTDSDGLFASLKDLASKGATVIVVTHRLPEVLSHCSRVTVLRHGQNVAVRDVAKTDAAELAELIVGKQLAAHTPSLPTPGNEVLKLEGITVRGDKGTNVLDGASLKVCAGELVGIAGVDGNGQRELFQALLGLTKISGRGTLFGAELTTLSPAKRWANGLRLIPEDRHEEGVVEEWDLIENAALGLHRHPDLCRGIWVRQRAKSALAQRVADRFGTKRSALRARFGSLSGGNQQRFVAARALEYDPKLILAFQPTRGLDVAGTADVYFGLRQACTNGSACLVVSFDLDELLEQCDRVLVMYKGKLLEPPEDLSKDRQRIGQMMVGTS